MRHTLTSTSILVQPGTDNGTVEFQDMAGSFLQNAAKAGKKKLVIDIRGNGGGSVFLGYDLFKQVCQLSSHFIERPTHFLRIAISL